MRPLHWLVACPGVVALAVACASPSTSTQTPASAATAASDTSSNAGAPATSASASASSAATSSAPPASSAASPAPAPAPPASSAAIAPDAGAGDDDRRIVEVARPFTRRCFEKLLPGDPDAWGRVNVAARPAKDRCHLRDVKVTKMDGTEGTVTPPVLACVKAALERLDFCEGATGIVLPARVEFVM